MDISIKSRVAAPAVDVGIAPAERASIAAELNGLVVDTYALYLRTHAHHWNVTGPWFATLHRMFEEQYTELWNAVDLVAERVRALGQKVDVSPQALGATHIPATPSEDTAENMVADLVAGHETVIRTIRAVWPHAEAASDQTTLEILSGRLSIHEKTAWMLRSLLE